MEILCSRFGGLDGKPVSEIGFAIIICGLKLIKALRRLPSNGDNLQGDNIQPRTIYTRYPANSRRLVAAPLEQRSPSSAVEVVREQIAAAAMVAHEARSES